MKEKTPNGKKLGFICQEIGREINTVGSKASDVNMQKIEKLIPYKKTVKIRDLNRKK